VRIRSLLASPLLLRLLLFVAAPTLFFCALEGALWLVGFGKPTEFFIPDEKPGFYRTNPNFTDLFFPASFGIQPLRFYIRKHKEPNSVRVFVLGESAAWGLPDPDFGFAAQLKAQLKARYAGKTFEVYNLGIVAINSHVIYQIVRKVAKFEPDLLVVYMGNNEVIGPYGPGCPYLSSTPPVWYVRAGVWVRGTRIGQLITAILGKLAPSGATDQDYKAIKTFSIDSVRGNDPRLEAVYSNFATNLQDIVDCADRAGIKTVLATVVANLKDNSPFLSLHRSGLSSEDANSWKAAFDSGRIAWDLGDTMSATKKFEEALRIDPEFAETHFRLARMKESLGETELARRYYIDALHWDAGRFRPDPRINEVIRQIAMRNRDSVTLVDSARALGFDVDSSAPLAGHDIFFDHVHFNWTGNFKMAQMLADGCIKELFGPDIAPKGELDASGCVRALGYTPDAQLKMIQNAIELSRKIPFTNEFTFTEDQARWNSDLQLTYAQLKAPNASAANLDAVRMALELDPGNPSLIMRLGAMEMAAGNQDRALSLFEQAETLQPRSALLSSHVAEILVRLGRVDEAETLLLRSMGAFDDDYFIAEGALVQLWSATRQFDKGKQFFVHALTKAPSNRFLLMDYANFLVRAGNEDEAMRVARGIWEENPDTPEAMAALEMMIRIFGGQNRMADVDALTLEARSHQVDDYNNNRRLVQIYTAKNDPVGIVQSLQAMESCGPFSASQHLDLAHRLAELKRGSEMLNELAEAREVALIEGFGPRVDLINHLIGEYRQLLSAQ
jgi:tetratricopeptide (TPR) repeat protein